jgi:ABC-type transporter MlaC component
MGLFTESERTEFVDAFSRFLGMYYLGELQKRYAGERVTVERQEITGPTRARVIATVRWMDRPIPVEIRKLKTRGRWMAYDVSVFGISAVQVYRAQLMQICAPTPPPS